MTKPPAGSVRDTAALAERYSETSKWQHERGLLLLEVANPSGSRQILDLGCGTGALSVELARRAGPSGHVIAIDPDAARLEVAHRSLPTGLDNLAFEQASGEDLRPVGDGSVDLVHSNYALHWMLDLPAVLEEVRRILRPGGRFVTEFLGEGIQLFLDLLLMMPGGKGHIGENIFLDENAWRKIIEARDLEILDLAWPRFMLTYEDLQSLFTWLEATSQGAFDSNEIGAADRAALTGKYPGTITCVCKGLRMILRRPR